HRRELHERNRHHAQLHRGMGGDRHRATADARRHGHLQDHPRQCRPRPGNEDRMPLVRSRSGFTLIELMIVLVMLGLVGAITVKVLTGTQRVTVAQGERALMQSTARTGVLVLPSELREINPALGDITSMSATSITYRSMRTLAVSCAAPT